jgi:hypothetical protein
LKSTKMFKTRSGGVREAGRVSEQHIASFSLKNCMMRVRHRSRAILIVLPEGKPIDSVPPSPRRSRSPSEREVDYEGSNTTHSTTPNHLATEPPPSSTSSTLSLPPPLPSLLPASDVIVTGWSMSRSTIFVSDTKFSPGPRRALTRLTPNSSPIFSPLALGSPASPPLLSLPKQEWRAGLRIALTTTDPRSFNHWILLLQGATALEMEEREEWVGGREEGTDTRVVCSIEELIERGKMIERDDVRLRLSWKDEDRLRMNRGEKEEEEEEDSEFVLKRIESSGNKPRIRPLVEVAEDKEPEGPLWATLLHDKPLPLQFESELLSPGSPQFDSADFLTPARLMNFPSEPSVLSQAQFSGELSPLPTATLPDDWVGCVLPDVPLFCASEPLPAGCGFAPAPPPPAPPAPTMPASPLPD